jgi:hypothetical protein
MCTSVAFTQAIVPERGILVPCLTGFGVRSYVSDPGRIRMTSAEELSDEGCQSHREERSS